MRIEDVLVHRAYENTGTAAIHLATKALWHTYPPPPPHASK